MRRVFVLSIQLQVIQQYPLGTSITKARNKWYCTGIFDSVCSDQTLKYVYYDRMT